MRTIDSPPVVSVLIAAYNEGPSIGAVVRRCLAHTPGLREVLVVDDGSRDDTAAEAERAGASVFRMPFNQGKGAALREGFARVVGDVVVLLDGDGQDPPEEIPRLLEALAPEVDLVVGSRVLGRFEEGAITPSTASATSPSPPRSTSYSGLASLTPRPASAPSAAAPSKASASRLGATTSRLRCSSRCSPAGGAWSRSASPAVRVRTGVAASTRCTTAPASSRG
ncbi:MAG: glycosyltransferase family 2 protein [Planctomycetota bacterium]